MGQAKQRGSFEQRKQEAIANEPKPLSEEVKQEIKNHIDTLAKNEEDSARQLIKAYTRRTRFFDRIMHSAASPQELKGEL